MNKKLIALALASAFAAPAAMAADGNVVIYGNVGMSMDYVDGGTTSAATQSLANTPIAAGTTQAFADQRLARTFAQRFANSAERRGRISSNNSYVGFKGSEDLGNGLSAIWQWEFAVAFDTQNSGNLTVSDSQGSQSKRNTFAGLKSDTLGALTLGVQDTPVKTSTGKLDVFKDTLGDYRSIIGAMGGSVRAENSVLYTSPSMVGFTIRTLYGAGNEAGSKVATNNGSTNPRIWSVSGVYDNGPIYAALAHEESRGTGAVQDTVGGTAVNGNPVTPFVGLYGSGLNFMNEIDGNVILNTATPRSITYDSKLKTSRAGFGYNFGVFKLGVGYERSKSKLTATNLTNPAASFTDEAKRNAWYTSGAFTLGNTVLKAAYSRAGDFKGSGFGAGTGKNTGAQQITLGADYNFSKRTSLYALYTQVRNDSNAVYSLGGSSGIATVTPADIGQDPKGISLGMRHSF